MITEAAVGTYAAPFTEKEAKAKVGKTVSLLVDHDHCRKGDVGRVIDYHEQSKDTFKVVVRWNSSNGSEPHYDGFSRDEYDLLLMESYVYDEE